MVVVVVVVSVHAFYSDSPSSYPAEVILQFIFAVVVSVLAFYFDGASLSPDEVYCF